jgi:ribonuclease J
MTRISQGEHRDIKIRPGDTVVFSANPIPGNTIAVVNTIDRLMMLGANVIYGREHGIHVSGHGSQEDHKLMLALTKPKFFVPVHGEHRMLVKHAKLACSMGIPEENTVIINNGDIVELTADSIAVAGKVSSGIELVDRAGIVHENVMQERRQLAEDGAIAVTAVIDWEGKLTAQPTIHLRGVVTSIDRSSIEKLIVRTIDRIITERWEEFTVDNPREEISVDWNLLSTEIETNLQRLIRRELHSSPLVIFLLQTPTEQPALETRQSLIPTRRRRSTASVAS